MPPPRPRSFPSGNTLPSERQYLFLAPQKARVAATKHAHPAAALAAINADHIQLVNAGKRSALSLPERALELHQAQ